MKKNLPPRPENDFSEFIETYFQRCRQACPEIEGSAGKWKFEDLISGLSDFDTRFLTKDGLTAADWNRISLAVGKVHFELALERPEWARTLEHLPGVNLTWSELFCADSYYTEFCQWSFYCGKQNKIQKASTQFSNYPWSEQDVLYHWKRIAVYFGRYDRKIDPPINLGRFETKYLLHSRFLHYLAPPVHSAVCLLERKTSPGKLDAFRKAGNLLPMPEVMEMALGVIESHYEAGNWYEGGKLDELDDILERFLNTAVGTLLNSDTGMDPSVAATPEAIRRAVARLPIFSPLSGFFESIKFARFMKGRLWFYAQKVPWFDSPPLIRIELARLRNNFLVQPLEIFAKCILGDPMPWKAVLNELLEHGFSKDDIHVFSDFYRLADPETGISEYRRRSMELVNIYSDFLEALEKLSHLAKSGMRPYEPVSERAPGLHY